MFERYGGDIILYYGDISRAGYNSVSDILEQMEEHHEKVCLILITSGGDPAAGYRTIRALSNYYKHIDILIPDRCKSAGTLMCIGANQLIFGDRGELGPLDIQLSKPDELFENMSGLNILQAISSLETETLRSFETYLVNIRSRSGLRTKIAADIAVKLTEAFITPIASKIDPVTIGEHQRAMQIAQDYGNRLNEKTNSLLPNSLNKLIGAYPAHGFVIDRKEAKELFENVVEPDEKTIDIYNWVRDYLLKRQSYPNDSDPFIIDLLNLAKNSAANTEETDEQNVDQPEPDQDTEQQFTGGDNEYSDGEGAGDQPDSPHQGGAGQE